MGKTSGVDRQSQGMRNGIPCRNGTRLIGLTVQEALDNCDSERAEKENGCWV